MKAEYTTGKKSLASPINSYPGPGGLLCTRTWGSAVQRVPVQSTIRSIAPCSRSGGNANHPSDATNKKPQQMLDPAMTKNESKAKLRVFEKEGVFE